jgi:DNA-binding GntR family transcriptional regulator
MKNILKKDIALSFEMKSIPARMSLGEHIFKTISKSIIEGDLVAGTRLIENRLAKSLLISRTPVREALHKLHRDGLIKPIPKGGYAVTGLTKKEIEEIFDIRCLLESHAAGLAAAIHKESDLKKLEQIDEIARACMESIEQGKIENLPDINAQFYKLLYTMSESPKLIKMIDTLKAQTKRFRKIILADKKQSWLSLKTHEELIKLLKKRDSDKTAKLIKDHIMIGREIVLESLKNKKGEF